MFLISLFFSFKIKYTLKSLKADYKVSIFKVKARILLFKDKKNNLVTLINIRWLDYYQVQIPIIAINIFDRSHGCTLDSRTSIVLFVMLTYKGFDRAWLVESYDHVILSHLPSKQVCHGNTAW